MVNIVHVDIHCDDNREITAVEIKVKSTDDKGKPDLTGHPLVATVSAAFYKTTLLADVGESLMTKINKDRPEIVDLIVNLKENEITYVDVAKFVEYLQKALDETQLF